MPTFEYKALDNAGKHARGSIAAESASAARKLLRNRRLHATHLRAVRETSHVRGFRLNQLFTARRRRTVLEFTRQLSVMINADVKLTEALQVLITQANDPNFVQVLQNIRDQLLAGENLADGIKEYPEWFDAIFVAMVRVGEATGNLGRSLKLLVDHISKRHRLESKVKSALVYPAILVVICIAATIFLMTVVVPKLSKIIVASGRELPDITQFMMGISNFLINYWLFMIIAFFALWWLFRRTLASPKGRLAFDRFILKVPVLGELIRQSVVARFATTLAALIKSGMPMADGLKVVAEVTGNAVMNSAVKEARERIISGSDIATPLQQSNVVDPTVAHMITVGERTGELESMLITIAEGIEETTDTLVLRISSVIEPIIIVVMAIIVGFIIYAVILPIMQVADMGKM